MPSPVLVFRVVVASPGDVKKERDALIEVFREVNRDTGRPARLHLDMRRWEDDAHPGFDDGGPQGLIDPILDIPNCDLFIGILWSRLGSPTIAGDTGSEREFNAAINAWSTTRRPHIYAYFCQREFTPRSKSQREQWALVTAFKKKLPKQGFAWGYKSVADFKKLAASHLRQYLQEQSRALWNKDTAGVREMLDARAAAPPTIAVLGRTSAYDRHDKPMPAAALCQQSLILLGRALADAGYRIMVYDSREDYAGVAVVRGYLESPRALERGIRVRRPLSLEQDPFPGASSHPRLFSDETVEKDQWEIAFVPSLAETDGVIAAGNGQYTLLGGLQAIGAHLPFLALAGYGGITVDLWEVLKGQRSRFASDDEIALMAARTPTAEWAQSCVEVLGAQRRRRDALQIWKP
jgi:hypothetical protein